MEIMNRIPHFRYFFVHNRIRHIKIQKIPPSPKWVTEEKNRSSILLCILCKNKRKSISIQNFSFSVLLSMIPIQKPHVYYTMPCSAKQQKKTPGHSFYRILVMYPGVLPVLLITFDLFRRRFLKFRVTDLQTMDPLISRHIFIKIVQYAL